MQRVRKNWLVRSLIFVGGIVSVRLVSYVLHMTTLEKVYKPRSFRKTSHLEISQEMLDDLPRYCQTIFGRKMDPINLIFVGTDASIRRAFEKAGWDGAHPSTPLHVAFGLGSGLFNRSYKQGPLMPLYISIGLQDMAFQKVLSDGYGHRHHIRVWRTRHTLPEGNRLWVAAATYEEGFRMGFVPPFVYHRKYPDLDWERDYIAAELIEQGNLLADEPALTKRSTKAKPQRDPHGDRYFTDGKAKIIEIV